MLPRFEEAHARFEQPLRLLACALQHVGVAHNRPHCLDERFEEARLTRELELGRLVAPAFGDDQVRGDQTGQ